MLGLALVAIRRRRCSPWCSRTCASTLSLPSDLLLFLLVVVVRRRRRRLWPALVAAVTGFLLANWYFTPPLYTFTIAEGENLVALVVFLAVAGS